MKFLKCVNCNRRLTKIDQARTDFFKGNCGSCYLNNPGAIERPVENKNMDKTKDRLQKLAELSYSRGVEDGLQIAFNMISTIPHNIQMQIKNLKRKQKL